MPRVSDNVLKIWIWVKIILLALVVIYSLLFIFMNNNEVEIWFFFSVTPRMTMLVALLGAFILGSLLTVLIRMVFKTITQIRASRERGRTERLEREIAEMRTKSGRLQQRE